MDVMLRLRRRRRTTRRSAAIETLHGPFSSVERREGQEEPSKRNTCKNRVERPVSGRWLLLQSQLYSQRFMAGLVGTALGNDRTDG